MPMGDASYSDSKENYINSYVLTVNGTTATAINSSGDSPYIARPIAVFGVSVNVNPSIGSGTVQLHDASASGDSLAIWNLRIASAASQVYSHVAMFPRPIQVDLGVVIKATTVTGEINVLYKNRFT